MGYLKQFARKKRGKEKSEVLTARLPVSLYSEFKTYCDELGLSISEAVCLLVEREVEGIESGTTTSEYINDYKNKVNVNINSDDVVAATTETTTNEIQENTPQDKKKRNRGGATTKKFTTVEWQVGAKVPCPYCDHWFLSTNFSRHAKKVHNSTTQEIFTNEANKEKILAMVADKKVSE